MPRPAPRLPSAFIDETPPATERRPTIIHTPATPIVLPLAALEPSPNAVLRPCNADELALLHTLAATNERLPSAIVMTVAGIDPPASEAIVKRLVADRYVVAAEARCGLVLSLTPETARTIRRHYPAAVLRAYERAIAGALEARARTA